MGAKTRLAGIANSVLKLADLAICRRSAFEEFVQERDLAAGPSHRADTLPPGAAAYLVSDNPRLVELRRRYRELRHPATDHTVWTDEFLADDLDLCYFRGDNAYVWQHRDRNTADKHLLTACYLREVDTLGLLDRLEEDELFGVYAYRISDRQLLTRDLLDSVTEISFLERALHISRIPGLEVLDVGSGYGRLAYRMAKALPNLAAVHCVDAVAESTFLAEYYLRYRGVDALTPVIPLDELEAAVPRGQVHLAVNVHSFAECRLAVVAWWIGFLRERGVRNLLVVSRSDASGERLLTREADGSRLDFIPTIEEHGYRLVQCEPKYLNALVQERGVSPAHHFLFELKA